jgi:hypothetical protein
MQLKPVELMKTLAHQENISGRFGCLVLTLTNNPKLTKKK